MSGKDDKGGKAGNRALGGSIRERFSRNLSAIKTLQAVDLDRRAPTPDERRVLAGYGGFGAIPQAFTSETGELPGAQNLLAQIVPDDVEALKTSTVNAHYTDPAIATAMWSGFKRLGGAAAEGEPVRILEPGCGAGWLIDAMPAGLDAVVTGVEAEPIAAAISRKLHARHDIRHARFEALDLPDGLFDGVVANVPYGNYQLYERRYRDLGLSVHDHFITKSLDKLKPGGIAVFLTSRYTLDQEDGKAREAMRDRAALIDAIRLPSGSFRRSANTDVVADLLVFQKRPVPLSRLDPAEKEAALAGEPDWISIKEAPARTGADLRINAFMADNPDRIIGTLSRRRGAYGQDDLTVERPQDWPADSLAERVGQRIESLLNKTQRAFEPGLAASAPAQQLAEDATKEFGFQSDEAGRVMVRINGRLVEPEPPLSAAEETMVRQAIMVRDAVRRVLATQLEGASQDDRKAARAELNRQYDAFVASHGFFAERRNGRILERDPEGPLLAALEVRKDGGFVKADIFSQDIVAERRAVTKTADMSHAIAASLDAHGRLDLGYMASLLGKKPAHVEKLLLSRRLAFRDPDQAGAVVTINDYLAGDVVAKLAAAKQAATVDVRYQSNVEALQAVLPKAIKFSDIDFEIGAAWLPREIVKEFVAKEARIPDPSDFVLGYDKVRHAWTVEPMTKTARARLKMRSGLGSPEFTAREVLEAALNGRTPLRRGPDGQPDREATAKAELRIKDLSRRFRLWIAENGKLRASVEGAYNQLFNRHVEQKWDGGHLTFPGMSRHWAGMLRPRQKDAIWRGVNGNTMFAHEVGWGKSPEFIATAIEAKRLGLATKPMVAVHKPTLESFRFLARDMYPGARILVYPAGDVDANKRNEFFSRAATGNWDLVIVTHDALDLLPMDPTREIKFLREILSDYRQALSAAKAETGNRKTRWVKEIETSVQSLESRIRTLTDSPRKDNTVYWGDLGVDWLGVDEFHKYKNLFVATRLSRVKGLPSGESQRAANMYYRALDLAEKHGRERGFVTGTGTPLTNSIAEAYTLQRYHQPLALQAAGLAAFDAWVSTFARARERIEADVAGRLAKATRLSEFVNTHELRRMVGAFMDTGFTEDVPGIERPEKMIAQAVIIPPSAESIMISNHLASRADDIAKRRADDRDNMLLVATQGRMAALDPRLIDPGIKLSPRQSKIETAARIMSMVRERNPGQTQLAFFDVGIHAKDEYGLGDELIQPLRDQLAADGLGSGDARMEYTARAALKEALVRNGVPAGEIEDFFEMTPAEQEAAKDRLRAGISTIGIGSSERLGTGVNVQERLIATHDLDAPLLPAFLAQRRGRMDRHGNLNKRVYNFRYVGEGTFDVFLWQLIDTKDGFIRSFIRGSDLPRRMIEGELEDISAAQLMALASGDPLLIHRSNLRGEIEETAFRISIAGKENEAADRRIGEIHGEIAVLEEALAERGELARELAPALAAPGVYTPVGGEPVQDRKTAAAMLLEEWKRAQDRRTASWTNYAWSDLPVGEWRGFPVYYRRKYPNHEPQAVIKAGSREEAVALAVDGSSSVFTSMDAALRRLIRTDDIESQIAALRAEQQQLQGRDRDDGGEARRLEEMRWELARLEAGLMLPRPSAEELKAGLEKHRSYGAAVKAFETAWQKRETQVNASQQQRETVEREMSLAYAVMVERHPSVQATRKSGKGQIEIPASQTSNKAMKLDLADEMHGMMQGESVQFAISQSATGLERFCQALAPDLAEHNLGLTDIGLSRNGIWETGPAFVGNGRGAASLIALVPRDNGAAPASYDIVVAATGEPVPGLTFHFPATAIEGWKTVVAALDRWDVGGSDRYTGEGRAKAIADAVREGLQKTGSVYRDRLVELLDADYAMLSISRGERPLDGNYRQFSLSEGKGSRASGKSRAGMVERLRASRLVDYLPDHHYVQDYIQERLRASIQLAGDTPYMSMRASDLLDHLGTACTLAYTYSNDDIRDLLEGTIRQLARKPNGRDANLQRGHLLLLAAKRINENLIEKFARNGVPASYDYTIEQLTKSAVYPQLRKEGASERRAQIAAAREAAALSGSTRFSFGSLSPEMQQDPLGLLWNDPQETIKSIRVHVEEARSLADLNKLLERINQHPADFGHTNLDPAPDAAEAAKLSLRKLATRMYSERVAAYQHGLGGPNPAAAGSAGRQPSAVQPNVVAFPAAPAYGAGIPAGRPALDLAAGGGSAAAAVVRTGTADQEKPGSLLPGAVAASRADDFLRFLKDRREQVQGDEPRTDMEKASTAYTLYKPGSVPTRFSDVAGAQAAREALLEVVDFLKNPAKYNALGARMPKGCVLVGEPGAGKTHLARALAGEANVPFFVVAGPDFNEKYVGDARKKIQALFAAAKAAAPAIVFIDEIESLGSRQSNSGRGGSEAINQLLVELDGFDKSDGVYTIAATNHPGLLDPALMREGRLTSKVTVALPNYEERIDILKLVARGIKADQTLDYPALSKRTSGASGAALAELVNEAALAAARRGGLTVTMADFDTAFDRRAMQREGRARGSTDISGEARKRIGAHLAGHILAAKAAKWRMKDRGPVIEQGLAPIDQVFIVPEQPMSRSELLDTLSVLLAGRAAEEVLNGPGGISEASKDDLAAASRIAGELATELGMGAAGKEGKLAAIGATRRPLSNEMLKSIEAETEKLVRDAYQRSLDLMEREKVLLNRIRMSLVNSGKVMPKVFAADVKFSLNEETGPVEVMSVTADPADGTLRVVLMRPNGERDPRQGYEDHDEMRRALIEEFGSRVHFSMALEDDEDSFARDMEAKGAVRYWDEFSLWVMPDGAILDPDPAHERRTMPEGTADERVQSLSNDLAAWSGVFIAPLRNDPTAMTDEQLATLIWLHQPDVNSSPAIAYLLEWARRKNDGELVDYVDEMRLAAIEEASERIHRNSMHLLYHGGMIEEDGEPLGRAGERATAEVYEETNEIHRMLKQARDAIRQAPRPQNLNERINAMLDELYVSASPGTPLANALGMAASPGLHRSMAAAREERLSSPALRWDAAEAKQKVDSMKSVSAVEPRIELFGNAVMAQELSQAERNAAAKREIEEGERVYFEVPIDRRREALRLGAALDKRNLGMYALRDTEVAQRLGEAFSVYDPSGRAFIAVPPKDRRAAFAAGAEFDEIADCFYVPAQLEAGLQEHLLKSYRRIDADPRVVDPLPPTLGQIEEASRRYAAGLGGRNRTELAPSQPKPVLPKPALPKPVLNVGVKGKPASERLTDAAVAASAKSAPAIRKTKTPAAEISPVAVKPDMEEAIRAAFRDMKPTDLQLQVTVNRLAVDEVRKGSRSPSRLMLIEDLSRGIELAVAVAQRRGIAVDAGQGGGGRASSAQRQRGEGR